MDATTTRACSDCGTVTLWAAPPCEDGHDLDCPDLMCLDCGAAVTGTWSPDLEAELTAAA